MQVLLGPIPSEPIEIVGETLRLFFEQMKKKRVSFRKRTSSEYSEPSDWMKFLQDQDHRIYSQKLPRHLTQPCTDPKAQHFADLIVLQPNVFLDLVIEYYHDLTEPRQISIETELTDSLRDIFRESPTINIHDRYLLRATKAIISGSNLEAQQRRDQLHTILEAAQHVAKSRNDDVKVTVNVYSEVLSAHEWAVKNNLKPNDYKKWKSEWVEFFNHSDTLVKIQDFAKWCVDDGSKYPNLEIQLFDQSTTEPYASDMHDRFMSIPHSETWISSAGFALRKQSGKIKPRTYLMTVARPEELGKGNSRAIFSNIC